MEIDNGNSNVYTDLRLVITCCLLISADDVMYKFSQDSLYFISTLVRVQACQLTTRRNKMTGLNNIYVLVYTSSDGDQNQNLIYLKKATLSLVSVNVFLYSD